MLFTPTVAILTTKVVENKKIPERSQLCIIYFFDFRHGSKRIDVLPNASRPRLKIPPTKLFEYLQQKFMLQLLENFPYYPHISYFVY